MDAEELQFHNEAAAPPPSLARNSIARLGASIGNLVFGFVTSVITARALGPATKGALSSLSFLGDIFLFSICSLGIGEAAIILIGQRKVSLQRALSGGLLPLFFAGLFGVGVLFLIAIPADWGPILGAVALEGVILVLTLYVMFFVHLLNSREIFGVTSILTATRAALTALAVALFVLVLPWDIEGALLAAVAGLVVANVIGIRALKRLGLSFRPRIEADFLRLSLRFGVVLQLSHLVMAASQRADQLVVYSLAGPAAGGRYSVALTLGQLPAYIPMAISHASFPRLAHLDERDVWPLTAQTARIGILAGTAAAAVLAALIPVATPVVFGREYSSSVVPALILLPGGLLWSQQWILARAWAARGRTGLFLRSFVLSVGLMLVLDLAFVPMWGQVGAAVASVAGTVAGWVWCLIAYARAGDEFDLRALVPRGEDVRLLFRRLRGMVRR